MRCSVSSTVWEAAAVQAGGLGEGVRKSSGVLGRILPPWVWVLSCIMGAGGGPVLLYVASDMLIVAAWNRVLVRILEPGCTEVKKVL